jgi:hypothetical protein
MHAQLREDLRAHAIIAQFIERAAVLPPATVAHPHDTAEPVRLRAVD